MNDTTPRTRVPTHAISPDSDLFVKVPTFHQKTIRQYVAYVMQATDQYASTGSLTYAAYNLAGGPTHFPNMGDFSDTYLTSRYGNWWQQMPSSAEEFGLKNVPPGLKPSDSYILCRFVDNVYPLQLEVYETLGAGAIQKVWMRTVVDEEMCKPVWALLWDRENDLFESSYVVHQPANRAPFTITLRQLRVPGQTLLIELNHRHLDYHAGIDSILLKGGVDPPVYIPNLSPQQSRQQEARNNIMHENSPSIGIDQLPDELLLAIFENLDLMSLARAAQVCKRFHSITEDPHLYRVMNLRPYWMMTSPQFYRWASKRVSMCKKLDVSWNPDPEYELCGALIWLLNACRRTLTHLRLNYNESVTGNLLATVTDIYPQLQELSINGCSAVPHYTLENEQGRLTNLVRLNMSDNAWLNSSILLQIVAKNPNLQHLNINFCDSLALPELCELLGINNRQLISLNAVKAGKLTSEALCCLAACTKLQELDVGWTFQELNWQTEHLRSLLIACPAIKKLFLNATRNLKDSDMLAIAGACSKLEQLSLVGCNNITATGIQQVLQHCKNLKLLDISHCQGVEYELVLAWQNMYTTKIKRIQPVHNNDG